MTATNSFTDIRSNPTLAEHDCDLCGSSEFTPIDVARPYIGNNEPPVVCRACGFVYVRGRRTSAEVAASWDDIWGEGYTSEWPAVKARLFYVAEWLDQTIGLKGKSLLDIGAGEGTFLEMARDRGAWPPAGIEPCEENVKRIRAKGIECFHDTVQTAKLEQKFDVVTLLWTLENCTDCVGMLKRAREWLRPNGVTVVATGSRILVPFKKPLSKYFSDNPADTHCFRFSAETLPSAFYVSGFKLDEINQYRDSDCLICIGSKAEGGGFWADNVQEVLDFFKSWSEQFP